MEIQTFFWHELEVFSALLAHVCQRSSSHCMAEYLLFGLLIGIFVAWACLRSVMVICGRPPIALFISWKQRRPQYFFLVEAKILPCREALNRASIRKVVFIGISRSLFLIPSSCLDGHPTTLLNNFWRTIRSSGSENWTSKYKLEWAFWGRL